MFGEGLPTLLHSRANQADFLNDLFAKHASDRDFFQALAWASIEKLGGLAHRSTATSYASLTVKDLVKTKVWTALRKYPAVYRLAKRIASIVEGQ